MFKKEWFFIKDDSVSFRLFTSGCKLNSICNFFDPTAMLLLICFYFLLATGGFAVVENDRLVQMAAEIEAISGRDRSASYLIRNVTLLEHNLILPCQSVVKQRDTAEERAAKAKDGATAKSSKRRPFSVPPVVEGKKLKRSDGPSPSTCPDIPEEEGGKEERG